MKGVNNASVYLRALELSDIDRVLKWHNDETLYDHLGGVYRWVSRGAEEEWLKRRVEYSSTEINLAICVSDTDEHIGNIYLRNIDMVSRHGELHLFIGMPEHRGHGYGQLAIQKILSYVFNNLGLQRIYLFVLAFNTSAIRLYRKCGFIEEGRMRNHAFKGGRFHDVLIMATLRDEFNNIES